MTFLRWFCFCILITSCFSQKSEKDDLDITTPVKSDKGHTNEIKGAIASGSKATLASDAVTQWQAFFKSPPTPTQRKLLDQRITAWAETKKPTDLLKKARAEIALGRLEAGSATLRQLLRAEPKNEDALLELANVYLRKRDLENTFDILSQIKELITVSEKVASGFVLKYRYTLALAYLSRGDTSKGHAVLSDLIGEERSFTPAYVTLASSYINLGKDQVAEFVARRGIDRAKDSPGLLNIMGLIAQRSGLPDTARTWYDKAIAASPTYVPALVNRATISAHFLEYGAAEEDLMAAIQSDPTCVDALIVLAHVQKKQGNTRGAKSSLTKALDLDPMNAFARFNMGVLLADDMKNPSEALRLFREVLQTKQAPPYLRDTTAKYIRNIEGLEKT
jgi:Tfp pilus assembly protein PilF